MGKFSFAYGIILALILASVFSGVIPSELLEIIFFIGLLAGSIVMAASLYNIRLKSRGLSFAYYSSIFLILSEISYLLFAFNVLPLFAGDFLNLAGHIMLAAAAYFFINEIFVQLNRRKIMDLILILIIMVISFFYMLGSVNTVITQAYGIYSYVPELLDLVIDMVILAMVVIAISTVKTRLFEFVYGFSILSIVFLSVYDGFFATEVSMLAAFIAGGLAYLFVIIFAEQRAKGVREIAKQISGLKSRV